MPQLLNHRLPRNGEMDTLLIKQWLNAREIIVRVPAEYLYAYGFTDYDYEYGDGAYPEVRINEAGITTGLPINTSNIYAAVKYKNQAGQNFVTYVDNGGNFQLANA